MRIKLLGSGANDWRPEQRREGEFFRRLSGLLIDGGLLIDPGPHIYDFAERNDCPGLFDGVENILVSHSHTDHFNDGSVRRLSAGHHIGVFCNDTVAARLDGLDLTVTVLRHGDTVNVGGYTVTALNANHSTAASGEQALIYIVEGGGRTLFYGLDSAWMPYESWRVMKTKKFDCMIIEVTLGDGIGDRRVFEHNNIRMAREMLDTFKSQNILGENCLLIASHFSQHAHENHEALSRTLAGFGMSAAYDGMTVEF